MMTLRGRYRITGSLQDVREIDTPQSLTKNFDKAYYTMDRGGLREKIIGSGIYSAEQLETIEKEGCKRLVANGLCVSPFTKYRYYLIKTYTEEIIKGIKIMSKAVASDGAELVVPKNDISIVEAAGKYVRKAPNIDMRILNDNYPLGLLETFCSKTGYFENPDDYYPGKDGIVITPVEDLLKVYLAVEGHEKNEGMPVMVVSSEGERVVISISGEATIDTVLDQAGIDSGGIIIMGDPLRGRAVADPAVQKLEGCLQIFVMKNTDMEITDCSGCSRCREVCPVHLRTCHSKIVLDSDRGIIPFYEVDGCIGCGLCGFFCPGWKK
ncbi:MAG: hypothetical protein ABIH89_03970 [Elusimicrobiota bacterium]